MMRRHRWNDDLQQPQLQDRTMSKTESYRDSPQIHVVTSDLSSRKSSRRLTPKNNSSSPMRASMTEKTAPQQSSYAEPVIVNTDYAVRKEREKSRLRPIKPPPAHRRTRSSGAGMARAHSHLVFAPDAFDQEENQLEHHQQQHDEEREPRDEPQARKGSPKRKSKDTFKPNPIALKRCPTPVMVVSMNDADKNPPRAQRGTAGRKNKGAPVKLIPAIYKEPTFLAVNKKKLKNPAIEAKRQQSEDTKPTSFVRFAKVANEKRFDDHSVPSQISEDETEEVVLKFMQSADDRSVSTIDFHEYLSPTMMQAAVDDLIDTAGNFMDHAWCTSLATPTVMATPSQPSKLAENRQENMISMISSRYSCGDNPVMDGMREDIPDVDHLCRSMAVGISSSTAIEQVPSQGREKDGKEKDDANALEDLLEAPEEEIVFQGEGTSQEKRTDMDQDEELDSVLNQDARPTVDTEQTSLGSTKTAPEDSSTPIKRFFSAVGLWSTWATTLTSDTQETATETKLEPMEGDIHEPQDAKAEKPDEERISSDDGPKSAETDIKVDGGAEDEGTPKQDGNDSHGQEPEHGDGDASAAKFKLQAPKLAKGLRTTDRKHSNLIKQRKSQDSQDTLSTKKKKSSGFLAASKRFSNIRRQLRQDKKEPAEKKAKEGSTSSKNEESKTPPKSMENNEQGTGSTLKQATDEGLKVNENLLVQTNEGLVESTQENNSKVERGHLGPMDRAVDPGKQSIPILRAWRRLNRTSYSVLNEPVTDFSKTDTRHHDHLTSEGVSESNEDSLVEHVHDLATKSDIASLEDDEWRPNVSSEGEHETAKSPNREFTYTAESGPAKREEESDVSEIPDPPEGMPGLDGSPKPSFGTESFDACLNENETRRHDASPDQSLELNRDQSPVPEAIDPERFKSLPSVEHEEYDKKAAKGYVGSSCTSENQEPLNITSKQEPDRPMTKESVSDSSRGDIPSSKSTCQPPKSILRSPTLKEDLGEGTTFKSNATGEITPSSLNVSDPPKDMIDSIEDSTHSEHELSLQADRPSVTPYDAGHAHGTTNERNGFFARRQRTMDSRASVHSGGRAAPNSGAIQDQAKSSGSLPSKRDGKLSHHLLTSPSQDKGEKSLSVMIDMENTVLFDMDPFVSDERSHFSYVSSLESSSLSLMNETEISETWKSAVHEPLYDAKPKWVRRTAS